LTGEWRYRRLEALSASGEHIEVVRPVLKDDECLVIDVHSHASLPAFFSSQDNRDDHAEVKLCAVFGLCNRAVTELRIRSVATQGLFYPLLNKAGLKELSLESLEDTGHALFLEAMNGPSD
jgi:PRTRC genetic system protein A